MNVGAIGGAGSAAWNTQSSSRPAPPSMTETAKLLGMSGSELTQQLQSGRSLNSIASSKGVSQSALLRSVESDLKANAPAGAPSLSGSQITQIATSIVSGKPAGGVGGPQGIGSAGVQAGKAGATETFDSKLLAELKEAEESSESNSSQRTLSYDGVGKSAGASGSTGNAAFSLYA